MPDPSPVRKRSMPKFNAIEQAQRFLNAYVAVCVVFNFGRQLVSAENYQNFRLAFGFNLSVLTYMVSGPDVRHLSAKKMAAKINS